MASKLATNKVKTVEVQFMSETCRDPREGSRLEQPCTLPRCWACPVYVHLSDYACMSVPVDRMDPLCVLREMDEVGS